MILDLCGGEVSEITTDQTPKNPKKIIEYDYEKTKPLAVLKYL